jgi:hypothetical protein
VWADCGDIGRFYSALDDCVLQLGGLPGLEDTLELLERMMDEQS